MAAGYDKHECTICLGVFNKPKLLPCYHTFCEDCLSDHIQTRATNNKFSCPVCRASTDVPAGGARGFQNNFYLDEEDDKRFCSKHKKMKLKFYCRDCSEVVCGDCVVVKHRNHNVDNLATVEDETKQHLKPLTEQLEEKVAELKTFSENLTLTVRDINTTADTACKKVDKQTEKICQQLREQAQDMKTNIIQIQDDSKNTVHKLMEDINKLITQIETGVNCSRDVLTGKTTSKLAVDILPNIQTLIKSGRQTIDLPEVRYPLFTLMDIDTQCVKKLLGGLVTGNEPTCASLSFNAMKMEVDEWYNSDELVTGNEPNCASLSFNAMMMEVDKWYNSDVVIHDLPWCISVRRGTSGLDVNLQLKKGGVKRVYSCTVDTTLKLVNHTDDSQSVVEKRESKEYTSGERRRILIFDWEILTNPANGFLQDNRFTIVASVKVTKIDKQ